jgi:isovaleryl-CoA dehydrogenase
MFLVEKGFEGFRLGQKIEDKCGMRASMTAELVFDDCKVSQHTGRTDTSSVSLIMSSRPMHRARLR